MQYVVSKEMFLYKVIWGQSSKVCTFGGDSGFDPEIICTNPADPSLRYLGGPGRSNELINSAMYSSNEHKPDRLSEPSVINNIASFAVLAR